MLADNDKARKISSSQQFESFTLVKKCLTLLEIIIDHDPLKVSDKLMHSDNVIDYLLSKLEPNEEPYFDVIMG